MALSEANLHRMERCQSQAAAHVAGYSEYQYRKNGNRRHAHTRAPTDPGPASESILTVEWAANARSDCGGQVMQS